MTLRLVRLASLAVVVGILLWIPANVETGTVGLWSQAWILAIAAMGLNLVYGYTGMFSIGHSAFFGVGAYTTAILVTREGMTPIATVPVAVGLGFVIGCLVALPAIRIKGLYLVLVTMAVGLLFPALVMYTKLTWLTNGAVGISSAGYIVPPGWAEWMLGGLRGRAGLAVFVYWISLIAMVLALLVTRGVVTGRTGRSLIAIRDHEGVAAMMGVNVARTKLLVFAVSAALCALAGSVTTVATGLAAPEALYLTVLGSIFFLIVMIVGGAGTLLGPVVGAIAYVFLNHYAIEAASSGEGVIGWLFSWTDASPGIIIFGALIIVLMFLAPTGLVGIAQQGGRRLRRFAASRAPAARPPVETADAS